MSKITAVLNSDLHLGFSLSGITVFNCKSLKEQVEVFSRVLEKNEIGMIIVDEAFMDSLDPLLQKDLLRRTRPLVIPIPGTLEWKDTEEKAMDDLIHQLLRKAVGYQLNIQF